jgi:protein-disulfide isomerase
VGERADGQVNLTVDPAMARGATGAPVTIVEFSDYQCPHCQRVQASLAQVMHEYDGQVRLVVKDFPLASHRLARPAHEAARCAARAGQFWPYREILFEAQPRFERDDLLRYALQLGLDRQPFARCLDERAAAAAVEADVSQGRALGVRSTPTFFVNGHMLVGAQPADAFRHAIEGALVRGR